MLGDITNTELVLRVFSGGSTRFYPRDLLTTGLAPNRIRIRCARHSRRNASGSDKMTAIAAESCCSLFLAHRAISVARLASHVDYIRSSDNNAKLRDSLLDRLMRFAHSREFLCILEFGAIWITPFQMNVIQRTIEQKRSKAGRY